MPVVTHPLDLLYTIKNAKIVPRPSLTVNRRLEINQRYNVADQFAHDTAKTVRTARVPQFKFRHKQENSRRAKWVAQKPMKRQ